MTLNSAKMCDALQLNWKLPNQSKSQVQKQNSKSDNNNNNKKQRKSKKNGDDPSAKYTLRACSIQKRIETEHRKSQPRKRGPKPRPKPLPMSKYRRKTANLRERQRMGEINTAFDLLRDKVPTPLATGKGRCEKMTKINILHVAISYIRALESLLDTGDVGVQIYGTSMIQSPFSMQSNSPSPSNIHPTGATSPAGSSRSFSTSTRDSSMSGSEDSGIMDDEEDEEMQQCPDWTELTSTLEFTNAANIGNNVNNTATSPMALLPKSNKLLSSSSSSPSLVLSSMTSKNSSSSSSSFTTFNNSSPPTLSLRGNLDTLLTSSAIVNNGGVTGSGQTGNDSSTSGTSTTSGGGISPSILLQDTLKFLQSKSLQRQLSLPDIAQEATDYFSDLSSSFDSFDGLMDFQQEDSFLSDLFVQTA